MTTSILLSFQGFCECVFRYYVFFFFLLELYEEDIGFLFLNSCSSGLAEMIEVAFGSTESTMYKTDVGVRIVLSPIS